MFFKVGSRLCSQVWLGASYVAQAGLKLDPLLLCSECWDCKQEPQLLAIVFPPKDVFVLLFYECFACRDVCVPCVYLVLIDSEERVPHPQGLELPIVVSHHVDNGN